MLRWLRVRNFALIDELELEFDRGLNLLSGETGAGKSLIVDALALVGGRKASGDVIRSGQRSAVVEAVFDCEIADALEAIGIDAEDEVVIRREIWADDRNRVFINSQPSTVSGLRRVGAALLDIHGQHEHQVLLDPLRQLSLLDRAADAGGELVRAVRSLYETMTELEKELSELETTESEILQRMDLLGYQRHEIEQVDPQPDEADSLRGRIAVLEHAGKLFEAAGLGYETLYEADSSVLAQLSAIERALRDAETYDGRLQSIADQVETARTLVEESAFALRSYTDHLDVDPSELEALQARLADLERLHRKYGLDLLAHLRTVIQEMDTIGLRESRKDELSQRLSEIRERYSEAAAQLRKRRRTVAGRIEKAVTREVRSLAMAKAQFGIEWSDRSPGGPTGIDGLRFVLAANPGEDPAPLSSVASGGELSRTMLALRTVLAGDEGAATLVFDEVDAGVGGEAAEILGRKLKDLSDRYQVLCVTHLAQIARFGDHHARIEKLEVEGRTVTRVETLEGTARVEELARMMSGASVTEAARRHVRELLKRP